MLASSFPEDAQQQFWIVIWPAAGMVGPEAVVPENTAVVCLDEFSGEQWR